MGDRAALIEIFCSIQGEGRHVGVPMSFVRVATCPIRCAYCDTKYSYTAGSTFRVRLGDEERQEPNPATAEAAADHAIASAHARGLGRDGSGVVVSVTGGEPLVYPEFVVALASSLGARGRVHLETAALDPMAMRAVLGSVAHVSADLKLPSTLIGPALGDDHIAAITAATSGEATVDLKVVVTDAVSDEEFECALRSVVSLRERLSLIVQPATPIDAVRPPTPERLVALAARAVGAGFEVRVLPQVHRSLSVE